MEKIVIDIPNGLYANLKKIQNGSTACSRILELAQNGTPLEKVFEDIKADIKSAKYASKDIPERVLIYSNGWDNALKVAIDVIDKHIAERSNS